MKTRANIIIPVHNRWDHTQQTLESLINHTDPELYKLYVVNDASEKEVTLNLAEFHKNAPVSFELIYNPENIGPGASRNMVTKMITEKEARSAYLYHSDNDVYFTKGWLEKLIKVYEDLQIQDSRVLVLGGSCHPYLQNNTQIQVSPGYGIVGLKDAVSGYSQLMTWETWDKYGPFDETMRGQAEKIMGSEDWAFCQKIIKDGYKVGAIEPEVVIPCGKTNTYGKQATGAETFKSVDGVMVK